MDQEHEGQKCCTAGVSLKLHLFLDIDENVIEVKERSRFLECSVLEQRQTGGQLYFIAKSIPVFPGTGQ